jgi:acetyltransferase
LRRAARLARTARIGFASVISLGAVTDVDFGELLEFALADPETDGILLYLETLRARAFSALRAAAPQARGRAQSRTP